MFSLELISNFNLVEPGYALKYRSIGPKQVENKRRKLNEVKQLMFIPRTLHITEQNEVKS